MLVITSGKDEHNTGEHQENALRTALLCGPDGCLRREPLRSRLTWISDDLVSPASLVDLLRVHELSYLQHLENKCRSINIEKNANIQLNLPAFYAPNGYLDTDTPLSPQSLDAARNFCGAAILAVDLLMNNTSMAVNSGHLVDRAFVVGRPPGHHAGP